MQAQLSVPNLLNFLTQPAVHGGAVTGSCAHSPSTTTQHHHSDITTSHYPNLEKDLQFQTQSTASAEFVLHVHLWEVK